MYRYILNRLLLSIPTLIGAAALVFILMRLIPGDICVVRLGSGGSINPTAVANCHAQLGLDRSLVLQFFDFIAGFARGDFGTSMWSGKPVSQEIATRIPVSLEIALLATLVAVLIAIPLGTISALHQNSWLDHIVRTVAIAGIAARAKGLFEHIVVNRHALQNALLPVVTLIGIEFAFLIGGLVVTEQVFNLNGVGRLFVLAVQNQDYTLTQALVMLTVAIFVVTNLAVDVLYAWLDPRIRFG